MKDEGAQKNSKHRLRICLAVAIMAAVLVCVYNFYWAQEEQKTFHRTKVGYAMIETEYYSLEVPAEWLRYVTVEITPVNEIYGGWEEDGQERIAEDNYQVQLYYKTDSGTYPIADIAMYAYLSDCLEQLDDWRYLGQLNVGTTTEKKAYHYDYVSMYFYRCNLIIDYAAQPTSLTAEELDEWHWVQDSLFADVLQGKTDADEIGDVESDTDEIGEEEPDDDEISEAESEDDEIGEEEPDDDAEVILYCKTGGDEIYSQFSPNTTSRPHGWAKTWDEVRQDSLETSKKLAELVKEREEKEAQSSASTETDPASKSSSGKVCIYPGCRNWGVSYNKGYCHKHYQQLYGTRDDFYDEDPESYYQDNGSLYGSRSEAYDEWEDEYEED